jgi:hypothetical protein
MSIHLELMGKQVQRENASRNLMHSGKILAESEHGVNVRKKSSILLLSAFPIGFYHARLLAIPTASLGIGMVAR